MAVTVCSRDTIDYSFFSWEKLPNGCFKLRAKAWISIPFIHNGQKKTLFMTFSPGYICDGLSVPKLLRWFLKNWDDSNDLYNLAGVVHDALYTCKGFGIFTREECDDFFRGLLRCSGQDRKHASTADFFLWLVAGSHWGNDDYHCKSKILMSLT